MKNNNDLINYLVKNKIIKSKRVEEAFRRVDRKEFIENYHAYSDIPLPIEMGQTISQPTTVAIMTELLQVKKNHRVLEIGTGSGYQAAILSFLAEKVYTTERIGIIYNKAKERLSQYKNIEVFKASKDLGLKKHSPFDRIIVTAAAQKMPNILIEQLTDEGIMVVPVGIKFQIMHVIKKHRNGLKIEDHGHFRFVPLVNG